MTRRRHITITRSGGRRTVRRGGRNPKSLRRDHGFSLRWLFGGNRNRKRTGGTWWWKR